MNKENSKKYLVFGGAMFLAIAFVCFFILNIPTVRVKNVSFKSTYKDAEVTLKGSYWEKEGAEYAVLICPGYSCDRQKWRPMADLLLSNGFTVMSFDYAGQGASSDTIGFDNAKTDNIPLEISDAIEKLHMLSGIDYDKIILLGHSMGGRAILRLLYDYNSETADTQVVKQNVANVILLSPEVNYGYNAQASLFAGTSDATEEPWLSYNPDYAKGVNVYLYGSVHDDIVSPEDVIEIFRHLGGNNVSEYGKCNASAVNENGSLLTVGVTGGVLHSYIMYSPKFVKYVNSALSNISGRECNYGPWHFKLVYAGWITSLLGLFMFLYALNYRLSWKRSDEVPVLINEKQYIVRKLVMWLPATVVAFLICCICVVMPFGSPVMNTPYMCFIAGYGIMMLIAYRKGKFKGTEGKLPKLSLKLFGDRKDAITGLLVSAALCFFVWYGLRSTMYRLIPLNARLFWVLFATILMAIGYYVSGVESDMLKEAGASVKTRFFYNLIQYVPLFLLVVFYMVLKSYSGMIGQVQNMLLMYIFCVPVGEFIKKKTGNRLAGACVCAFLFQTLMITSAALIAIL